MRGLRWFAHRERSRPFRVCWICSRGIESGDLYCDVESRPGGTAFFLCHPCGKEYESRMAWVYDGKSLRRVW